MLLPDTAQERTSALTIWPLPGSRGILYTRCPDNCALQSEIHVIDLRTGDDRMLVANAAGAWYSPTGHLLYADRNGGLYAEGFDLGRLRTTTGPMPVIDDVVPGSFTISASGSVLYETTGAGAASAQLVWVSRDGSAVPLDSTWLGDFHYPALSPDGKSLAVSLRDQTTQLWIRRSDGTRQKLTEEGTTNWRPAWTRGRPVGRLLFEPPRRRYGGRVRSVSDDDRRQLAGQVAAPSHLRRMGGRGLVRRKVARDALRRARQHRPHPRPPAHG